MEYFKGNDLNLKLTNYLNNSFKTAEIKIVNWKIYWKKLLVMQLKDTGRWKKIKKRLTIKRERIRSWEQISGYQRGRGLESRQNGERDQTYGDGWHLDLWWWSLCSVFRCQIVSLLNTCFLIYKIKKTDTLHCGYIMGWINNYQLFHLSYWYW